ncbi:hypothetical protein B0H14DRAFT_2559113 [Mycena olivaceomarginata]|nr:hypothetical protein B0H14DRAFT_2559113 [Mycena olivaceomarginata]
MDKLVSMAIGSQSLSHNVVRSHLSAIKAETKWDTDQMLDAVAEYIKGAVEYSGTVFRTCFSINTTFAGGVPSNISIPTHVRSLYIRDAVHSVLLALPSPTPPTSSPSAPVPDSLAPPTFAPVSAALSITALVTAVEQLARLVSSQHQPSPAASRPDSSPPAASPVGSSPLRGRRPSPASARIDLCVGI